MIQLACLLSPTTATATPGRVHTYRYAALRDDGSGKIGGDRAHTQLCETALHKRIYCAGTAYGWQRQPLSERECSECWYLTTRVMRALYSYTVTGPWGPRLRSGDAGCVLWRELWSHPCHGAHHRTSAPTPQNGRNRGVHPTRRPWLLCVCLSSGCYRCVPFLVGWSTLHAACRASMRTCHKSEGFGPL
ncbi:hypothetical protein M011DRAFT_255102 [Sporormia fimetaria CBS 119925]|uniref:Uncharacterized protein n=1 Tax=Sporormia fimetaria CBS 119925 TaxID=1340428 RepID=A0A6A6V0N9_9PLEO|nr:hypothetical protein M011DRAFT_255102 [Sporormia fimetaria CBS 119925]